MNYSQLEHQFYDVINSIDESRRCSEETLATVVSKVIQNNMQSKFMHGLSEIYSREGNLQSVAVRQLM